jgi:transcriptional regulator with XRE-family HTH domain
MYYIKYNMNINELGEAILVRRKILKMTQATLATSNGMSRATLSNLENGKLPELGLRKFIAICATLGLELELKEESLRPTLRDLVKEKTNA